MKWILFFSFALETALASPLKIIVDPGHGGRDVGASFGTMKESDIVLTVSRELVRLLNENSQFEAQLTRQNDIYKSLVLRANEANKMNADLFVSIHANASQNGKAKGAEFYFQNQLPAEEEAMFLAAKENQMESTEGLEPFTVYTVPENMGHKPKQDVLNILEDLSRQDRVITSRHFAEALVNNWDHRGRPIQKSLRQGPFFLLSHLKMPSVLIELGFITNYKEAKELTTLEYQKKIAQNIYSGIKSFKEFMDKRRSHSLN